MKLVALIFSFGLFTSLADARLHMVNDDSISSNGTCLAESKMNSKLGLEQLSKERIAAVMKRLKDFGLDEARFLKPLKFNIVHSGRSNQYGVNMLVLSTACLGSNGEISNCPIGAGLAAHEIGHWIGGTMDIRGRSAYQEFQKSGALAQCVSFTTYCTTQRSGVPHRNTLHETFAEVFSAYVTHPNLLKRDCPKGYEFMKEQVFKGKDSSCPRPQVPKKPEIVKVAGKDSSKGTPKVIVKEPIKTPKLAEEKKPQVKSEQSKTQNLVVKMPQGELKPSTTSVKTVPTNLTPAKATTEKAGNPGSNAVLPKAKEVKKVEPKKALLPPGTVVINK